MEINLLPWREKRLVYYQRKFIKECLMMTAIIVFVGLVLGKWIDQKGENQKKSVNYWKKTQDILKPSQEMYQKLVNSYENNIVENDSIEEIKKYNDKILLIFREISDSLPKDIYLSQVELTNNQWKIEGEGDLKSLEFFTEKLIFELNKQNIQITLNINRVNEERFYLTFFE